jgi:uncharacterized protein (DUF2249 family)
MTQPTSGTTIDVRTIPPRERHPLIFQTFHGLGDGATMDIINDHDPRPLYYQMQAEQPCPFTWDYLQSGPEVWHVRITKRAPSPVDGSRSA